MYIRPTLPLGGVAWVSHALTQPIAALSAHIGSFPGVAGASGMQVKPLVPWRRVRILPWASIAMMVACLPTLAGAARIALAIICASLIGLAMDLESVACAAPRQKSNAAARAARRIKVAVRMVASRWGWPAIPDSARERVPARVIARSRKGIGFIVRWTPRKSRRARLRAPCL